VKLLFHRVVFVKPGLRGHWLVTDKNGLVAAITQIGDEYTVSFSDKRPEQIYLSFLRAKKAVEKVYA